MGCDSGDESCQRREEDSGRLRQQRGDARWKEIGCGSADGVERDQERDRRQQPTKAQAGRESGDSVNETVGAAHGLAGQCDEQRGGAADVPDGQNDSTEEQSEGNGAARILNFVAHGGSGLNGAEGEEDAGPEDGVIKRPVGDQAGARNVRCGAKTKIGDGSRRMRRVKGKRLPRAPMLLSHLPASTPRMLSAVMNASQNTAKAT